ncbi:dTDP-glucose 4,6-dehydratase [Halorubrum distributum]|uniref:UDP-glucose 4-epimerase n=1 Tax=Halorubrum distributum JCM 13916 TaxID=1230455 RepID=M0PQD5_9EURY|nr:dTDP-glucose 4,6-dehydratase [Halorubrum arcis]EMA71055.1 UDP-glucose 4-epimerase [Halorubrum arcis JCM 13916]
MRVLVTGGAGFIGSNFVHHVLETTDHHVVTLDSLTYAGTTGNLSEVLDHERHQFVEGDIRDKELVDGLVEDCDVIVNFAAESHVDRSIQDAEPFVSTNVDGTRTLLDAALEHDLDSFVQISTDEVYGTIESGSVTEEAPLDPRNPYSATKASADLLALSYHTTHDLPVLVTRSSNNYGPHQHREKLIPKFITRAAAGETLPVYGDGSNVREWLYVEDNCRAIMTVLEKGAPGEVYNIGSGTELTNIDVTERIIEMVDGSEDQIEFVEDRPGHDQRYSLDATKLRSLGWEPERSFEDGLAETVEHYL